MDVQWVVPGKTIRLAYTGPRGAHEEWWTLEASGRFSLVRKGPHGTTRVERTLEDGWFRQAEERVRYAFLSDADLLLVRQQQHDGTWTSLPPVQLKRVATIEPIDSGATPPAPGTQPPRPPAVAKTVPPPPQQRREAAPPQPKREAAPPAPPHEPSRASSPVVQAKGCAKNVERIQWGGKEYFGIRGEAAPIPLERVLGTYDYEGGRPQVILERRGGKFEVHGAPKRDYVYDIVNWWVETACDGTPRVLEGARGKQYTLVFELDREYQGQKYDRVPLAVLVSGPPTILGERVRRGS